MHSYRFPHQECSVYRIVGKFGGEFNLAVWHFAKYNSCQIFQLYSIIYSHTYYMESIQPVLWC